MLLNLPDNQIQILTRIFNGILKTGYFPTAWKTAKIIMIPKKGKDPTVVNSYRQFVTHSVKGIRANPTQ